MIYKELYDEFITLFPEDKEYFRSKEEETGAEREDGMHVMFGLIICPYNLPVYPKNSRRRF